MAAGQMLYSQRQLHPAKRLVQGLEFIMLPESSDARLLAGLEKHELNAIGDIYDQYFPDVFRYIRYRIIDDAIAEDLASDVFLRLIEATRKKHGPRSSLKGWLITTASNVVNDHLRRRYRRPETDLSDSMSDPAMDVSAEVDARSDQRRVRAAYDRLTNEQQHVLALRFGQGYSLEETAEYLKKNVNAVKALQFRALASLQRLFGEVFHE